MISSIVRDGHSLHFKHCLIHQKSSTSLIMPFFLEIPKAEDAHSCSSFLLYIGYRVCQFCIDGLIIVWKLLSSSIWLDKIFPKLVSLLQSGDIMTGAPFHLPPPLQEIIWEAWELVGVCFAGLWRDLDISLQLLLGLPSYGQMIGVLW